MISWDPDPIAFHIPVIDFDVYWYSLLFGLGFLVSYFLVLNDVKIALRIQRPELALKAQTHEAVRYTDRLALFMFFSILLGARLGHVLFYDWSYFSAHPGEIFSLPMRGLSSHGATFGILIGLFTFYTLTTKILTLRPLLDSLARAAAFTGGCIRVGNFINQEIIGTPSTLPWAVAFGHPVDPVSGPAHPVQLYEALFYFTTFVALVGLKKRLKPGMTIGLFCILVFTFRFFIEYLKLPQGELDTSGLHMGQLLSLPMIAFGLYLLITAKDETRDEIR